MCATYLQYVNSVKPRLSADLYYRPFAHQLLTYFLWKIMPLYGKITEALYIIEKKN